MALNQEQIDKILDPDLWYLPYVRNLAILFDTDYFSDEQIMEQLDDFVRIFPQYVRENKTETCWTSGVSVYIIDDTVYFLKSGKVYELFLPEGPEGLSQADHNALVKFDTIRSSRTSANMTFAKMERRQR